MDVGEKIGKFQVMSTLGTGAHSTILHVRRQADGKQYALKVVPINEPDDVKFLEQARHEFRFRVVASVDLTGASLLNSSGPRLPCSMRGGEGAGAW